MQKPRNYTMKADPASIGQDASAEGPRRERRAGPGAIINPARDPSLTPKVRMAMRRMQKLMRRSTRPRSARTEREAGWRAKEAELNRNALRAASLE